MTQKADFWGQPSNVGVFPTQSERALFWRRKDDVLFARLFILCQMKTLLRTDDSIAEVHDAAPN
jgi:hypothetical protein